MDAKYIKCAAKCCGNKLLDRSDLTFFTFPEDDRLAKIWTRNANITSYQYGSVLCSEHFENKYFANTIKQKSVFRQNVEPVPTIFNIGVKMLNKDLEKLNNNVDPLALDNTNAEEPPLDFNEYCRLCANFLPASNLISLFDTSNNFSELLSICLPGKVKLNDNMPRAICTSCAHKLRSCASTLKIFKEADKKLRVLFQPSASKELVSKTKKDDIISISDDDDISDDEFLNLTKNLNENEAEGILSMLENVLEETNKILDEIVPDEEEDDVNDTKEMINHNLKKILSKQPIDIIKFKCVKCPSVFNTKEKMMVHAFHDHPNSRENKLICNIIQCKEPFSNGNTIASVEKYQCIACSMETPTKEGIIKHTKKNHPNIPENEINFKMIENPAKSLSVKYMCVLCPKVFNNKSDMQQHGYLSHPNNKIISKTILVENILHCRPVRKNFNLQSRRKNWQKPLEELEINELKYKCVFCPNLYDTYEELLDHSAESHPEDKITNLSGILVKKLKDEIIPVTDGTIFEANPNVSERRPTQKTYFPQHNGVRYKCLQCPKLFVTKKLTLKHNLETHPVSSTANLKCKIVSITSGESISRYYRRERFECLICCSHHVTKYSLMCHTKEFHTKIKDQKYLFRLIEQKSMKHTPLECLHCDVGLLNYNQYKSHLKKHYSFNCEQCDEKFDCLNSLKNHLKKHNTTKIEPEVFSCICCKKEFEGKSELTTHEKEHKIFKELVCPNPKCKKTLYSEYELRRHEMKQHDTRLCDICGKVYEVSYIRSHLQTHNKDPIFKCKFDNCSKVFKTRSSLFRHTKNHTNTHKTTICQVCGKILSVHSIALHMKIHSKVRNEICDICGAGFYRRDHLRHHRARHSNGVYRTPAKWREYVCPVCDIILENRKAYLTHATVVHGIEEPKVPNNRVKQPKNLSCVVCERKFSHRCYLEEHYRIHTGERIYKCKVCDKSFATRITLYQHKLTHQPYEEMRYRCDICDKRFRRSAQLRDHRRVHTGEKPFPCPVCQRPFRVRGEMVKHMRIHTRKEERVIPKKKVRKVIEQIFDQSDESEQSEQDERNDPLEEGTEDIERDDNIIYYIQEDSSSQMEYIVAETDMPSLE